MKAVPVDVNIRQLTKTLFRLQFLNTSFFFDILRQAKPVLDQAQSKLTGFVHLIQLVLSAFLYMLIMQSRALKSRLYYYPWK